MASTSTSKKSGGSGSSGSSGSTSGGSSQAPRSQSRRTPKAVEVASRAASDLLDLTGKEAESIVGLRRTDDGWAVQVEVVEMRRIPDSTDVLALYEVDTDAEGSLEGYRRLRRYVRGNPREDA